jgi:hypothetical protein
MNNPTENKKKRRHLVGGPGTAGCFCCSCFILVIILPLWALFGPFGFEKPFRQPEFNQVITLLQSGKLKPDARGLVILPDEFSSLTATGKVYVTPAEKGRLIVFFPSWVGRQSLYNPVTPGDYWIEGYLYDSAKEETNTINAPDFTPPWKARASRGVMSITVVRDKKLTDHWYHVAPFS